MPPPTTYGTPGGAVRTPPPEAGVFSKISPQKLAIPPKNYPMPNFTLTSHDLRGQITQAQVYNGFGAGGDNRSPHLAWTDAPAATESFLVTCHDTDAPGPGGWWHWVAFNLPATVEQLPTNASADGLPGGAVQLINSYGERGYGGACPPPGDPAHPYVFTVYALKSRLDLDESASPAMTLFMAASEILAKTSLVAYYAR